MRGGESPGDVETEVVDGPAEVRGLGNGDKACPAKPLALFQGSRE